jgi:hypothetical protein
MGHLGEIETDRRLTDLPANGQKKGTVLHILERSSRYILPEEGGIGLTPGYPACSSRSFSERVNPDGYLELLGFSLGLGRCKYFGLSSSASG